MPSERVLCVSAYACSVGHAIRHSAADVATWCSTVHAVEETSSSEAASSRCTGESVQSISESRTLAVTRSKIALIEEFRSAIREDGILFSSFFFLLSKERNCMRCIEKYKCYFL